MKRKPDGVFIANGRGESAETGKYAVPEIKKLVDSGLPVFGICLGHQMLGLALGAKTQKMHQGHHGANHPVKDFTTGKVEITSMNHGFAVDRDTLPPEAEETHVSLFDGSNCGLKLKGNRHEIVRGALLNWLRRSLPADVDFHAEPGWRADGTEYVEPDFLVGPAGCNPTSVSPEIVALVIEVARSSLRFDTTIKASRY